MSRSRVLGEVGSGEDIVTFSALISSAWPRRSRLCMTAACSDLPRLRKGDPMDAGFALFSPLPRAWFSEKPARTALACHCCPRACINILVASRRLRPSLSSHWVQTYGVQSVCTRSGSQGSACQSRRSAAVLSKLLGPGAAPGGPPDSMRLCEAGRGRQLLRVRFGNA